MSPGAVIDKSMLSRTSKLLMVQITPDWFEDTIALRNYITKIVKRFLSLQLQGYCSNKHYRSDKIIYQDDNKNVVSALLLLIKPN